MSGQRVALVTGASRGIGAAAAIELARRGIHPILIARTQGGLEETDDAIRTIGATATLLPLDLLDGDQIDALGPTILNRFGRLDILLHNAGALGKLTPAAHILPKDWVQTIGVNLTAAWRLIRSCGPLLEIAPAGRALFVTSSIARAPRPFWAAYGASKAGMEHLALSWAAEQAGKPIRINLFDPGPVATRLRRDAMPGEDQSGLATPASLAPPIADACEPTEARTGTLIAYDPARHA